MGWFLSLSHAKAASTRKKKPVSGRGAGPEPWNPHRTILALWILGAGLLGLGLIMGWRYGERALLAYAAQRPGQGVRTADIDLVGVPGWMSETVQEGLRHRVAGCIAADPLDGRSLRVAAGTLADDPWVQDVRQVRRLGTGRVMVEAVYREPVALVRGASGFHLVDEVGVVLPGLYLEHQIGAIGLPVLGGVASEPGQVGRVWPGRDIQAGLALIRLVQHESYAGQVRRYDVGRRDGRGRVKLVMHTDGGLVVWGLPPGDEYGIEPTSAEKLAALRQIASASQYGGRIDAGGQVVAVSGPRPQIVPEPMAIPAMDRR